MEPRRALVDNPPRRGWLIPVAATLTLGNMVLSIVGAITVAEAVATWIAGTDEAALCEALAHETPSVHTIELHGDRP